MPVNAKQIKHLKKNKFNKINKQETMFPIITDDYS